ncbi:uncharacterized protein LOC111085886 [Limulus polyphemus]|uniref:Uncharacterized protein LOC111085886 n=1 Tax=Limulus polyphemus TaxID=6850 RepID=A0ABM1SF78_LIMPO|nr:uncharacterized protein LOC111085886 [Limulus polyphemus]
MSRSLDCAALRNYNSELATNLEELYAKREEIDRQISTLEKHQSNIQHDVQVFSNQLSKLEESLMEKLAARDAHDQLIREIQNAYLKILQCSQSLLEMVKTESSRLSKRDGQGKNSKR